MMEHSKTNDTFRYSPCVRHRPSGDVVQQIAAMFAMLGGIILLLWFIE